MSTPLLNERDLARFMRKVMAAPNGCWLWSGALVKPGGSGKGGGYGQFSYGGKGGPNRQAHRVAYEHFKGMPPEGHQVDHLCHTEALKRGECTGGEGCPHRSCVNPDHLEAVTPRENTLRGDTVSARNARKTHCPQGHVFDDANTGVSPDDRRICRACKRVKALAWHAAKRSVA